MDIDRESCIKLAETFINGLKKNGVEFDVCHYNAILRVRNVIQISSLRNTGVRYISVIFRLLEVFLF